MCANICVYATLWRLFPLYHFLFSEKMIVTKLSYKIFISMLFTKYSVDPTGGKTHRKPPLPNLRIADVSGSVFGHLKHLHISAIYNLLCAVYWTSIGLLIFVIISPIIGLNKIDQKTDFPYPISRFAPMCFAIKWVNTM